VSRDFLPARTNPTVLAHQGGSAANLLMLLAHPSKASAAEVASEFQALHRRVESLPLTSAEFCLAHNWLTSAQCLWEAGDANAGRYQVAAVVRRLGL
jgi:hypothetical protein